MVQRGFERQKSTEKNRKGMLNFCCCVGQFASKKKIARVAKWVGDSLWLEGQLFFLLTKNFEQKKRETQPDGDPVKWRLQPP